MRFKKNNEEVLVADESIIKIGSGDIDFLKQQSQKSQRRRIRFCGHLSNEDRLHEMFIVHAKDAYVQPHKHINKSESVHVVEGRVDVVFFDNDGEIVDVVRMGDYQSGQNFYYRVSNPYYHTLIIRSDFLVFHEVTNGPFIKEETIFAPWAPKSDDKNSIRSFLSEVSKETNKLILK